MKLAGFGVWLLLLGAGEVCGVILGEWRGEDPADSDIPLIELSNAAQTIHPLVESVCFMNCRIYLQVQC